MTRAVVGNSIFLAAALMGVAMSRASEPVRQATEEAPEPEIDPEPVEPLSRQRRRHLARQAEKAARRKPPA